MGACTFLCAQPIRASRRAITAPLPTARIRFATKSRKNFLEVRLPNTKEYEKQATPLRRLGKTKLAYRAGVHDTADIDVRVVEQAIVNSLCVDQSGVRCYDEDANVLTVIANESYDAFARGLQTESEKVGFKFGLLTPELLTKVMLECDDGREERLGYEGSERIYVTYEAVMPIDHIA